MCLLYCTADDLCTLSWANKHYWGIHSGPLALCKAVCNESVFSLETGTNADGLYGCRSDSLLSLSKESLGTQVFSLSEVLLVWRVCIKQLFVSVFYKYNVF